MAEAKPKLLVIEGGAIDAARLADALGGQFEIVRADQQAAQLILASGEVAAVVSDPDRLGAIGDELGSRLLNAIGEGVCLADPAGRVLWANEWYRSLGETTRERLSAVCRDAVRWFSERLAHQRPGDGDITTKFEIASAADEKHYEVSISPVAQPEGAGDESARVAGPGRKRVRVEQVAVVVRDVSAAKQRLAKIAALDRAGAELVRMDAQLICGMNAMERLGLVEQRIVDALHDLLSFDHFAIRLLDQRSGRLEMVVSHGLAPEAEDFEIFPEADGNGVSGYVAATGESYVCNDAMGDPLFLPGMEGGKSSLTVPLRLHDRVLGILNIESERTSAFNEEDRQFAEIFARYIAMALHMLDLLVVERSTVNQSVSGRVESELSEPLEDIFHEVEWLRNVGTSDPEAEQHIQRIRKDVEAIRERVKDVAAGPQTLLGVDRAMAVRAEDPALVGRRVLVADDEPKVRRIIRDVLTRRGCKVTACENGGVAIESLEAAGEPFDLVLSDIQMPDRNGYEVFSAARKLGTTVPVILMTGFGYDPHHSIVRASQEGLHAVLFKPLQVEQLIEEVRAALGAGADGA